MLARGPCGLLLGALLLTPACKCGDEPRATAPEANADALRGEGGRFIGDAAVLDAMEALGDDGAFVVVVRPDRWAKAFAVLAPWLARLPGDAARFAAAGDADALPELLALRLGVELGPVELMGWDKERPIVASLGEVPYEGPPGSVTPALPMLEGWMPPVRHELRMPATDAAALVTSIAAAFERDAKAWPELVEGREGARGLDLGSTAIALLPERDVVRVVLFQASRGLDGVARLEHLRGRLDTVPAKPDQTPALSLLAQPDGVVAGWVRPWRMRPLSTWAGGTQVVAALEHVAADQRAMLLARAVQIVLASELMMGDAGAEFDDMALSLVVDEQVLRLRVAVSLTPEGGAIFDAAEKGGEDAFAVKVDDAWIDAVFRVDMRAALDAAEVPPVFATATEAYAVANAVQEGGDLAMLYLATRHPIGMLRLLESFAAREHLPISLSTLPTVVHVVWRGMVGEVPNLALAAQWPEGHSTLPLTALVPLARMDRAFESLKAESSERRGKPVTLFGLGGDPAEVFDPSAKGDEKAMIRARVSLTRIGSAVMAFAPDVGGLLTGDALMTWDRRGRVLAGELAWAPAGAELVAAKVPVPRRGRWDSPMGPSPDAKGTRCLAEAGRSLGEALRASSTVESSLAGRVMERALVGAEAALQCAANDDATAEAAGRLRSMAVMITSEILVGALQADAAVTLLSGECERRHDERVCALAKTQAALPRPRLPEIEWLGECDLDQGVRSGDLELRLDASGVAIGGEPVAAADLVAHLKTAVEGHGLEPDFGDPTRRPRVALLVDRALTMVQVRPVLQALSDAGITELVVPVVGLGERRGALAVRLREGPGAGAGGGLLPGEELVPYGLAGPSGEEGAIYEVGEGRVTTHSVLRPEPVEHVAPSMYTLRDAREAWLAAFVYGRDEATWKDVAATLGAVCTDAALVLRLPRP